jgi:hypothetical protein
VHTVSSITPRCSRLIQSGSLLCQLVSGRSGYGSILSLEKDTGAIQSIGLWVLETACAQLKIWKKKMSVRSIRNWR